MTPTGGGSARSRSRAVGSVLLELGLEYAAALGEEYCQLTRPQQTADRLRAAVA